MNIIYSNNGNWDSDMLGMHGVLRCLDDFEALVCAMEGKDESELDLKVVEDGKEHDVLDAFEIDLIVDDTCGIAKMITVGQGKYVTNIYVAVSPEILRPNNG